MQIMRVEISSSEDNGVNKLAALLAFYLRNAKMAVEIGLTEEEETAAATEVPLFPHGVKIQIVVNGREPIPQDNQSEEQTEQMQPEASIAE